MSTGFNFGAGITTNQPASTGFSLGLGSSSTTAASQFSLSTTPFKPGGSTAPAVASPLTSSFLSKPATTTTTPATTTAPFKLGGLTSSTSTTPLAASTTTTTTSALTNPNATQSTATSSTLTFKTLEDYVNKWMSELDSQEKDFLNQATQLNALDKLMIENGDKIVDLSSEVDRLNSDQDQLEQELNFLYSQQTDLEGSIKKLEDGIEQMPTIPQQHCDTSRIEMYKLLIEVDNQLRSQSGDLRDIIKRLNCTNVNLNDPIMQINKILNAHMDSLNWIEENTGLIQSQTEKLSKNVEDRLRESDSSSKFSFLS